MAAKAVRSFPGVSGVRPGALLLMAAVIALSGQLTGAGAQTAQSRAVRRHDASLSDIYLQHAITAFDRGDTQRADELAETALLFDKNSPDALYMRGVHALELGGYAAAREYLTEALTHEPWLRYDPFAAREELAKLLFRAGEADRAYLLLHAERERVLQRPRTAALYADVLVQLGFGARAATAVRQAHRQFPGDERLQVLRIRLDRSFALRSRETIMGGDPQGLYGKSAYREALRHAHGMEYVPAGRSAEELGTALSLLQRYESRWGSDRFSEVYGLVLGDSSGWEAVVSSYDLFTGEEFRLLRQARPSAEGASDAGDVPSERQAAAAFGGFTGEVRFDANGDGYVDATVTYRGGEIESVERDGDQDARAESAVGFEDGRPRSIELRPGAGQGHVTAARAPTEAPSVRGTYGGFPDLVEAVYTGAGEELRMELIPYEVEFDPFVERSWSPLSPPTLTDSLDFPRPEDLLPYAARIRREAPEGSQTYSSETGSSVMYPTSKPRMSVIGSYRDAQLQRRMRDVDGDGMEEITESYENGRLVFISYDGNHNNRAEYLERHEKDVILRLWDIDEDGTYDYEMRAERR